MHIPKEKIEETQKFLDKKISSPEDNISELSALVGKLKADENISKLQRYVLDLDDLIQQTRWYIGNAYLISKMIPEIMEEKKDFIEAENIKLPNQMPTSSKLLLRGNITEADKVMYNSLTEPRRGGTFGGWIYHSLIDSSIYRTIASLDRLAHILWITSGLPESNVYFRSRKMKKIHKKLNLEETREIFNIAKSELINFIISYRDGFTHEKKHFSKVAEIPPVDTYRDDDNNYISIPEVSWDGKDLFALAHASYDHIKSVLSLVLKVCKKSYEDHDYVV